FNINEISFGVNKCNYIIVVKYNKFKKPNYIVSGQRWSVINRYLTKVTKSANTDNTVRQASSANDHISAYAHATEKNRNSLSGSQTQ
ncbi:hypothetical protein PIROE2DRAFT_2470, partial [Piromyces sp. E2]